ncbi:MAG: homoserine kinase [Gemmatimonadales bacterium]|nr:homoserine kinase [Gemmatimonadales bacterium]
MTALLARATAFAPGSIGNVGPGFDVLGLAVGGAGDTVTVVRRQSRGVVVEIPGHPDLPTEPRQHASALAAMEVLARTGNDDIGLGIKVVKGLPLSGGQGGSAASSVAGAVAANALLGDPLGPEELLHAAVEAEAVVAGRHADNVGPSLLGGLVLVRSMQPLDVVRLAVPDDLAVVLAHPDQRLRTKDARRVLPRDVPLATAIHQMAQVAAMVHACASGDLDLLGRAIDDRIAEPARATLLPGFPEAKAAALNAGALGCSISGSGPTSFALVRDDPAVAARVVDAMREAYARAGVACIARLAPIDRTGARVLAREAA